MNIQVLNITDIAISKLCMESYPCQHVVRIKDKETILDGIEIANLFRDHGLDVPTHFQCYLDE